MKLNTETPATQTQSTEKLSLSTGINSDGFKNEAFSNVLEGRWTEFYSENISDSEHAKFSAKITFFKNHLRIRTSVISEINDEEEISVLAFTEWPEYFDLDHRLVTTKDMGISGSNLLEKAEALLTRLMEKGLLAEKPLFLRSANTIVVSWALKNGFDFIHEEDQATYESASDVTDTEDTSPYVRVPITKSDKFGGGGAYIVTRLKYSIMMDDPENFSKKSLQDPTVSESFVLFKEISSDIPRN